MQKASSSVPCGSCQLCCIRQDVVRVAGDDADLHWTTANISGHGRAQVLARKPDGACVYLGPQGCTIYADRPTMCRRFDCREHYFKPAAERRKIEAASGEHDMAIVRRGRELVERARGK